MGHKFKQYHLQGLRSRFVGDDHILVAANSIKEADRLVRGAVSAALWYDWNCALKNQKNGICTKIDLRKKRELTEVDQIEVRSALGISDEIPTAPGENPVKAIYRYMRHANDNPGRHIQVVCPLDAFTVDNTSLAKMLSLGRDLGIRFVCVLTPSSRSANLKHLEEIFSECGMQILGPELDVKLDISVNVATSCRIINTKKHCVFSSKAKMKHERQKKQYLSKILSSLWNGHQAKEIDTASVQ